MVVVKARPIGKDPFHGLVKEEHHVHVPAQVPVLQREGPRIHLEGCKEGLGAPAPGQGEELQIRGIPLESVREGPVEGLVVATHQDQLQLVADPQIAPFRPGTFKFRRSSVEIASLEMELHDL